MPKMRSVGHPFTGVVRICDKCGWRTDAQENRYKKKQWTNNYYEKLTIDDHEKVEHMLPGKRDDFAMVS